MTFSAFIIPDNLKDIFEIQLPSTPCKTGLVKIFTGSNAGSWAANTAILDSCKEWKDVKDQALKLVADNNIQTIQLDTTDLVDPNAPKFTPNV